MTGAGMRIGVVTLFPAMFAAVTDYGVSGRALRDGIASLECWNPRDYAIDRHRTVDDRPYGGGPGMVMQAGPLVAAIRDAKTALGSGTRCLYLSPQGERLNQDRVRELAAQSGMLLVAGRYEGVDERAIGLEVDAEVSLGDFVLSGGELAAMALIDAVLRLQPGALGDAQSAEQDSFMDGLLDCDHYTRPEEFEGRRVPEVLLSGDHEKIRRWRLKQALGRTWLRRPDLLRGRDLDPLERGLLDEFVKEQECAGRRAGN